MFGIHQDAVGLFIAGQNVLQPLVEEQLYANYPDCTLDELSASALDNPEATETWSIDLTLVPDLFPCRRYGQFEDAINRVTADPLVGIFMTLDHLQRDGFIGRFELVVCPAGRKRPALARRILRHLDHPYFRTKPKAANYYAKAALSPRLWPRIRAYLLSIHAQGRLVKGSQHPQHLRISTPRKRGGPARGGR